MKNRNNAKKQAAEAEAQALAIKVAEQAEREEAKQENRPAAALPDNKPNEISDHRKKLAEARLKAL